MANKKLSAVIAIGGTVTGDFRTAVAETKSKFREVGAALREVEKNQKALNAEIKKAEKAGTDASKYRNELGQLVRKTDELKRSQQALLTVEKQITENRKRQEELRSKITDTAAMGAAMALPTGLTIKSAADFETSMLGIAKQVEGARDQNGNLTKVYHEMSREIQQLGRELPVATNELAAMVAAGARMGVAKDEVIGYTREVAMMAEAFELPHTQLSDDMGKIAGLYKIPIPAIGKLADAINYLDDNAISKGGDIIDFMKRTGGVASAVKVTGNEMAALGSTLLTQGEAAETASTAINALFSKLAAADKGTKKFKEAFEEIGLSTDMIQNGMQKDAIGTLMKLMEAIGKMPKEKQLGIMVDLVGLEHSDTLAKLANGTEEFRRQLALANSEAAKGSMAREFAARLKTTNAQIVIMKNRFNELSVNIGSALLPVMNDVLGAIAPVVESFATFARENPQVVKAVIGTALAFTAVKIAVLGTRLAFTALGGEMLKKSAKALVAEASLGKVATSVRAVGLALTSTPIGAAIAAIGVGALVIRKYWEPISAWFGGVIDGMASGMQPVVKVFKDFYESLGVLKPVIDAIGTGISIVIDWFSNLLEPVKSSSAELEAASAKGRSFGEVLGTAFELALKPLTLLIEGITWINNNIGAVIGKLNDLSAKAGGAAFDAVNKVKNFFGAGDPQTPTAPAGASLPAVPAMATAKGRGTSYTDSSQNTIQIYQQPGQNPRQLAEEITKYQEQQRATRSRSLLYDGVPQN